MDTREKLEADVRQWLQSRLIGNDVYETVISWLDRQEAITAQEWRGRWTSHAVTNAELNADLLEMGNQLTDMENQRDELQAKVDELTEERDLLLEQIEEYAEEAANFEQSLADFEQTHMRLPVDADGVPIRIGDTMKCICAEVPGTFIVGLIGADGHCMDDETSFFIASECRHVQPDTVESLLEEFALKMTENMGMYTAESIEADEWKQLDERTIAEFSERIRKAVEHE